MIYLDHAATSHPKPPAVLAAIRTWYEELGVSAERGDGSRCRDVARTVESVRATLARRCGTTARGVAFSSGATESINLFLRAVLGTGAKVLTTTTEHSSVARPLVALRSQLGLQIEVLPCDAAGFVDPERVERVLSGRAFDLLVLNHASNVTGAVQDVAPMLRAARECGCRSLLDASQTAGVLDLDVGADALVASAHKSLLGPPGLGFLAVRDDVAPLAPQKQGGTGSARALDAHPLEWPAAFEAGTPNTPALFGLDAALEWLEQRDAAADRRVALGHIDALRARLGEAGDAVRLHGPDPTTGRRLPILAFTLRDFDTAEAGVVLDEAGVFVRTGFHCAPWIHRDLGTSDSGVVRVSVGPFVTADEVLEVARALGL